jgi:hypothetical protein
MAIEILPVWMNNLDDEDLSFIKRFIISSGSLKEMAKQYDVTYPTVRLRLDRLIEKIKLGDNSAEDEYVMLIKKLALNEHIDFEAAKLLISEYRKNKEDK